MKIEPKIIFQDEQLLIVDKPANYLTIPDRFNAQLPSVQGWLNKQFGKVYTVHRLDKETSGVLCFALTAESHRAMSMLFEKRAIDKKYWVLAEGHFEAPEGKIEAYMEPDPAHGGMMRVSKTGKPAYTEYKLLEQFQQCALLEATIKTGRMHQIRVHFRYIGHHLLIDPLYGRNKGFYLSKLKKRYNIAKAQDEELPLMSRTTLHAKSLEFVHPFTGEKMHFETELPKDFNAVLTQLRKHQK